MAKEEIASEAMNEKELKKIYSELSQKEPFKTRFITEMRKWIKIILIII